MIFEDVHWIDPTSLEVLGRAVDRIGTVAVLLMVTYRLEYKPPWIGQPHVTALTLNRLGEPEIEDMIDGSPAISHSPQASSRRFLSALMAFRCLLRK